MKKISPRIIATNIFGTVGYLLTAFSWALVVSFVLMLLIDNGLTMSTPEDTASMLFLRHI